MFSTRKDRKERKAGKRFIQRETQPMEFIDMQMINDIFILQNPSRMRKCNDHMIEALVALAPEGCTVVKKAGNVLIRKGAASGPHPFYLAHLDQVHDYAPFMELVVDGDELSAIDANDEPAGVGGDDKCGIYVAMQMLHRLDQVTVVFVRDEEVGCLGSGSVPLTWFKHAAFVLQADRNNRTMDIIRETNGMNCASDEFFAAMLNLPTAIDHSHSEAYGSITDIGELSSRGLAISMVNISSGYHMPHCDSEYVLLSQLDIACSIAYEAARLLGDKPWTHTPVDNYRYYTAPSKKFKWETEVADSHASSIQQKLADMEGREPSARTWSFDGEEEETEYIHDPSYADYCIPDYGVDDQDISRDDLIDLLMTYGYDVDYDGLYSLSNQLLGRLANSCGADLMSVEGEVLTA